MISLPHSSVEGVPRKPRILVVEDEALVAADLEERLSQLGYDVRGVVDSAEDAIVKATELSPDLVLMDIHLIGKKDGIEAAAEIRQSRDMAVVFVTAHADDATLKRAGLAVPFGYILKPFDERELKATIEMALYHKQAELRLRKLEEELQRHAAQLEQTVAERTAVLRETVGELESFSYSVAHDMRGPLRSMRGFSQILMKDYASGLDAIAVGYLERIVRSTDRLDGLIGDVLNYTKILGGQWVPGPVDVDRLMRDILDSYPDWQPPKAEIKIIGVLPKLLGNEAFLTQCISNLLNNAVTFVSPGTVPLVRIWAEANGSQMRLCIRDNGIGIAADEADRVFRMFERLHPTTDYEGTGIGLTIARKAVERMGGELGFDSEPGKGSTFWVQLKNAESDEKNNPVCR